MFLCERCQRVSAPGERASKAIVETRRYQHPHRVYRLRGELKDRVDVGGVGPQIVREALLCASCAAARLVPPRGSG